MSIARIRVICGENVVQDGVNTNRLAFTAVDGGSEGNANDDVFGGTPMANIQLVGVDPTVAEKFERGKQYHLDFVNVQD